MSLIARVSHSSDPLNEQVRPEAGLGPGDHCDFRLNKRYETGWEKLEQFCFLEHDGEQMMIQTSIAYPPGYDETVAVTPTFCAKVDIDEWTKVFDVSKLTDGEITRVEELYANNLSIDRFDDMDALRSLVDGDGTRVAGLDRRVVKGACNEV